MLDLSLLLLSLLEAPETERLALIAKIKDSTSTSPKPEPEPFLQSNRSYKVRHIDNSITVLDLDRVDFAKVTSQAILLYWSHNAIEFTLQTTNTDPASRAISKDTYDQLAEFLTQ